MKTTCPRCEKQFNLRAASLARNKSGIAYCSRACRFQGKRINRICPTCGKALTIIKSWSGSRRNFCSYACSHIGFKVAKPILICGFCGKGFERYPSEIKKMSERGYTHVFCSHACRAAMIAAQFNPPKPYLGRHTTGPRNGTKMVTWRKGVFERDEYTCQDCGSSDTLLCAHHIKAFALYPDLRYEISNGTTLCYPCHEKRHSLSSSHSHQPP